ncbi:hypothetical protein AVEN_5728-1 [Araneus ventricosus]|uniref:Uncharacterized protein n=1 Tax=Araneus ventricosus TaxID=182803 RepID=A0A4Y2QDP9_ARAVE|nr:hypothetical protein AVEN_5728-1 [Araneus ventricosus]
MIASVGIPTNSKSKTSSADPNLRSRCEGRGKTKDLPTLGTRVEARNEARNPPFWGRLMLVSLFYLKSEIRSAALSTWQDNWDNGETGRSTQDIVSRFSNTPVGWNREETMFVTGHGFFPSYLHRFNLRAHDNCSCGEKGDPMHYATKCRFTLSWHFQTPTVSLKLQWLKNVSRITQEADFDS